MALPVGGCCVMLLRRSSRSFSPSLPTAALSATSGRSGLSLRHGGLYWEINSTAVCVCTWELFSWLSLELNSSALIYDRHLAGLIEVLFTLCRGVTALTFSACVCVCVEITKYHSPSLLAIAPRAWL